MTRRKSLPATVFALSLAAAMAGSMSGPAALGPDDDPEARALEEARRTEEQALQALLTGAPEERLEAATHLAGNLGLEFGTRREPPRPIDDLIDGLVLILRQEPDDWIARTLLASFRWNRDPSMNRLFHEALHSGSINVRAVAVRRFTIVVDPESLDALESFWDRDLPAWLRPRLVEALANQASATHLEDFMRLTRDADPVMRQAAIRALGALAREEAIPTLVRVVHEGAQRDQALALGALGSFPDSDEAFQEVFRVSRMPGTPLLSSTVDALGRFPRPEAGRRLIELLEAPSEPDLRGDIAEALERSEHPDATAALVRLLHRPEVSSDSWIAATARRVLFNRDDPDAIPGLQDLERAPAEADGDADDEDGIATRRDEIGQLISYLSRDRTDGNRAFTMTSDCSFGLVIAADDPLAWHVSPRQPLETVRCWNGPEIPRDPDAHPRIPGGTLVRISDYFETPAGTWVETSGGQADHCWVPLDSLEKGPAPAEPASWPRHHLRVEFDLRTEDLRSIHALRLAGAELLSVIEPGGVVTGAALDLDALDADQVALVRSLASGAHSPLDTALRALVAQIDPRVPARPTSEAEDSRYEDPGDQDDDPPDSDDDSGPDE